MAGGVHASRVAVRELSDALADNDRRSAHALELSARGASRVVGQITTELRARELEVQRAREALESCERQEDADCSRQRQRLFDATVRRDTAKRILHRVEEGRAAFASTSRRLTTRREELVNAGRRMLTEQLRMIDDYSATSMTLSGSGGGTTVGVAASVGAGASAPRPAGLPEGVEMIPLSAIDTSRSTVASAADFSPMYTPEDLDWAFDALEQVVLPALSEGQSPDVFRDRDARAGLMGTRSYSMTYSQFLGQNDAIRLQAGPNGYTIANGQHRIWVAQQGARYAVPARIVP
jgi:hypothetical protein